MLAKLAVLALATLAGVAASVRVWRLRRTPQRIDDSLPGPVPGDLGAGDLGPGGAGPLP